LLASTVSSASRGRPLATIGGAPPDLTRLPPGCAFAPRCESATDKCAAERPPLAREAGEALACWHPVELAAAVP
jgi:oligopeptide/dipeptide ABC transporter ATP-binding protein